MSEHQWKAFTVTIADGIAEVTLIGPGKGNVMGPDFWNELPAVFAELDRDDAVRVVVLSGSGKNFSYGLDLPGMAGDLAPALAPDSRAAARTRFHDMILRMQSGVNAVADCRKPVIAAIWGWCIGGGVDLITAADFRYARPTPSSASARSRWAWSPTWALWPGSRRSSATAISVNWH